MLKKILKKCKNEICKIKDEILENIISEIQFNNIKNENNLEIIYRKISGWFLASIILQSFSNVLYISNNFLNNNHVKIL